MNKGGMLFLGAAESTIGTNNTFGAIKTERGIYMKTEDLDDRKLSA